ncbi:MAG: lipoprotein signal peptidase [Candidatus Amulumruptor caecigallinarius]|nr:lipoprotein signal peptidase [Candidatus Amulumruptor caecigallinarius]
MSMAFIFMILLCDQILKIWVKTRFYMGEDHEIFPWFHLKFIENNGMAFGLELWNKLILTEGRIVAVALLAWALTAASRKYALRTGFLISLALITAGAAGNIIDCVFYGVVFNNPMPPAVAEFMGADGGYSTWFEGRVVDMFYFPFFGFTWPDWIPMVGGRNYEFFAYIFNVADASICIGVAMLIFFYSKDVSEALNMLGEWAKCKFSAQKKNK